MHFLQRCGNILTALEERALYPGVAKFGIALDWGSRGRRFKSCHSDHRKSLKSKGFGGFSLLFLLKWLPQLDHFRRIRTKIRTLSARNDLFHGFTHRFRGVSGSVFLGVDIHAKGHLDIVMPKKCLKLFRRYTSIRKSCSRRVSQVVISGLGYPAVPQQCTEHPGDITYEKKTRKSGTGVVKWRVWNTST